MTPEGDAEQATPALAPEGSGEEHDDLFEALWQKVLETWSDDKRHGAVLEYALRASRLPLLAGRYRALKDDAEKGAKAQKQLDAIVLSATQMMLAMKTPERTKVPLPITLSAFGVCVAILGLLAYALFHR